MDGNTGGNAFVSSLQQLGQWLQQQNQGTGSGQPMMGNTQQPSKVITQVHYAPPPAQTSTDMGQPSVTTAPATPEVSAFTPPQGSAQGIPQPGGVVMPEPQGSAPRQGGAGGAGGAAGAGAGAAGGAGGAFSGAPGGASGVSSAISGVTSALSKGFSNAGEAIGSVKTMPTPVQSGPFPTINQYTPTLIGRRPQQPTTY